MAAPANIYHISAQNSSSPSYPPEPTSDDVSLFLRQILLRSSSPASSSSSITRRQPLAALSDLGPGVFPNSGRISVPDPSYAPMNSSSRFGIAAANGSSSCVGRLDSEGDEYDYESEEVAEAVVEEMAAKVTPRRSSSKRSRTAEVHNQSEKRRRSRINEKMKALQNLIPNSNKTDKASMLDDAIEYLKQLQIQVQMLTMKNRLSLHPNCVPGMLVQQPNDQYTPQTRMDDNFVFNSNYKPSRADPTESISLDHQNISAGTLIRLQDKFTNDNKAPARVTDFSCMITPKTWEKVRICQPRKEDRLETSSAVMRVGAKAPSLIPCETNTSKMNETTLEACLAGGDQILQNFVNHPIFSSHLSM